MEAGKESSGTLGSISGCIQKVQDTQGCRGLSSWAALCCFPQTVSWGLDWKYSVGTQAGPHSGFWCFRKWLYQTGFNAGPSHTPREWETGEILAPQSHTLEPL